MKKLLLSLFLMVNANLIFAQIAFSSLATSNITSNSASLNAYVTINCNNGGNFHAQFSTNPSFSPSTNATGGSSFVSYPRTINISGLAPGTTYYWRYYGNLGTNCNQTVVYSPTQSFTTLPASIPPTIQNITTATDNTSANINYSLIANSASATSIIKYGLTDTSLTNQVTGGSATGSTNTPTSVYLNGLTPNTTYYYQIEATNSIGTTVSPIGSFSTTNILPNSLVAEYNFNNTYNNVLGNGPFSSNAGTAFASDRSNTTNNALYINNTGTTSTILGLPYGNSPRTVSVWIKMATLNPSGFNFIYNYGNSTNYYGAYFNNSNLYHFQNGSSHYVSNTTILGEWIHYVFTYDGTDSKIYKNGSIVGTNNIAFNTVNNGNLFRLGLTENGSQNYFNGTIDDLKIYNYAISDADVTSLFTNNTLSSQTFNSQNLKATIYPNPTSDNFTIEMENEVKSVEIYSIQGQKVMSSNSKNISVSDLSKGIYLVRIEDENNAVATQKLIIK